MTEDLIAIPTPFGHLHDGNGNQPLTFERGPVPGARLLTCSTVEVFTYSQLQDHAALIEARAVARTREECAKVCEDERVEITGHAGDDGYNLAIGHCAAAIRALGERT